MVNFRQNDEWLFDDEENQDGGGNNDAYCAICGGVKENGVCQICDEDVEDSENLDYDKVEEDPDDFE